MELNELLAALDSTAANLAKLDQVWSRAEGMIPTKPNQELSREYDDLCRVWSDLLPGLPQIHGWTIMAALPDADEIRQRLLDEWISGEHDNGMQEEVQRPGKELADYRYQLNRARRLASRERLLALEEIVETQLPKVLVGVRRDSKDVIANPESAGIESVIKEIERLMGDTTERRGRWGDLHRHLAFGQGIDWHDIFEMDWPSVKEDIRAGCFSENDPLPVPKVDLGTLASSSPTGAATTALLWDQINESDFERLLYDLFISFATHQNVQWLTKTNATDRGRDLSLERVLNDGTGGVRTERVIVQAKHWSTRSVGISDINNNLATLKLWEPPTVRILIVATSGHFSTDAIDWVERHNAGANVPTIELWPQSRLENLLAQKPHLIASHGLRR